MWDDSAPVDGAAPGNGARGAWRAPVVPTAASGGGGRRSAPRDGGRQKAVSLEADPVLRDSEGYAQDGAPIPRRTKNYAPARPWWRPSGTIGQVALGTSALLLIGGVVALGIVIHKFLVEDAHFRIPGASSIQTTGLSEVSRTEVLPIFGEDIGRNIFFVNLAARRMQLEAIPWVKQATVMRFLPDQVSVSIVERTPVAFVRQGQNAQQVELADADGVILDMPPAMMAQHHYSFPVVTGISAADPLPARKARMAVYMRFVGELDQNQQHLSEQVSEIDLSDPEDLRAMMPEQGADILAHFGQEQFLHRLQIYQAHIAEWRQRYPRLIGVDLRYNGEVPLEMGGDRATAQVATAAANSPVVSAPVKTDAPKQAAAKPVAAVSDKPKVASKVPAVPDKTKLAVKAPTAKKSAKAAPVLTAAQKKAAKKKADNLKAAKAKAAKPAKNQPHKAVATKLASNGSQAQGK